MSLIGSLIGWDQQKDAHNAILANHLVKTADPETKLLIAVALINIQRTFGGSRTQSNEDILADISRLSRIKQMNFVAIACLEAGIPSNIRGVEFMAVRNPYRSESASSLDRLGVSITDLSRRAGVRLDWPGNDVNVDFLAWVVSPPIANELSTDLPAPMASNAIEAAIDLAHGNLLMGVIDKAEIRDVALEFGANPHFTTSHELAAYTALYFFMHSDMKALLHPPQLFARLTVLEWCEEGKVSSALLKVFEDELYQEYK